MAWLDQNWLHFRRQETAILLWKWLFAGLNNGAILAEIRVYLSCVNALCAALKNLQAKIVNIHNSETIQRNYSAWSEICVKSGNASQKEYIFNNPSQPNICRQGTLLVLRLSSWKIDFKPPPWTSKKRLIYFPYSISFLAPLSLSLTLSHIFLPLCSIIISCTIDTYHYLRLLWSIICIIE